MEKKVEKRANQLAFFMVGNEKRKIFCYNKFKVFSTNTLYNVMITITYIQKML